MTEPRYLKTIEAAKLLGVSVTTVKRWVDEEILAAHKTAGGHRKILRAELTSLIQSGKLPCANAIALQKTFPEGNPIQDVESLGEEFRRVLMQEDAGTARRMLTDLLASGVGVGVIADRLISPVMVQIGHDWEKGTLDVHHEHHCSQVCLQSLHQVRAHLEKPTSPETPLALGGCPRGDYYQLSSLLAEMVLLEAGWRTVHLGPNTPMSAFRQALDQYRPRLVWLSISHLPQPEEFLREYREFYSLCEQRNVFVTVGGRALTDSVRTRMPYTTFGDGLSSLAAVARSLNPQPNLSHPQF